MRPQKLMRLLLVLVYFIIETSGNGEHDFAELTELPNEEAVCACEHASAVISSSTTTVSESKSEDVQPSSLVEPNAYESGPASAPISSCSTSVSESKSEDVQPTSNKEPNVFESEHASVPMSSSSTSVSESKAEEVQPVFREEPKSETLCKSHLYESEPGSAVISSNTTSVSESKSEDVQLTSNKEPNVHEDEHDSVGISSSSTSVSESKAEEVQPVFRDESKSETLYKCNRCQQLICENCLKNKEIRKCPGIPKVKGKFFVAAEFNLFRRLSSAKGAEVTTKFIPTGGLIIGSVSFPKTDPEDNPESSGSGESVLASKSFKETERIKSSISAQLVFKNQQKIMAPEKKQAKELAIATAGARLILGLFRLIEIILNWITIDGIYRVSAHQAAVNEVVRLLRTGGQLEVLTNETINPLNITCTDASKKEISIKIDAYVVCCAAKMILRDRPIITSDEFLLMLMWYQSQTQPNKHEATEIDENLIKALKKMLVRSLVDLQIFLLILAHMQDVAAYCLENRMDIANLARMFAPNIFVFIVMTADLLKRMDEMHLVLGLLATNTDKIFALPIWEDYNVFKLVKELRKPKLIGYEYIK